VAAAKQSFFTFDNCEKPFIPDGSYRMHSGLLKFVPGILLCLGLTVAASAFEAIEVQLFHEAYLEALVLAIILGVVIRSFWAPGSIWQDRIRFTVYAIRRFWPQRFLLEP
jgi:hypothetical protein